jgi:hypothetical protein
LKLSTADPATDFYYSNHRNGDTTIVAEVSGLNHIDICNSDYVHTMIVDDLVQRVYREELEARRTQQVSVKSEHTWLDRIRVWWQKLYAALDVL